MPFRLRRDESVEHALRRIAREQVDRSIADVRDESLDFHETVHEVRKRCKKLRGLLRLVRSPLERDGTYALENARYRDAARLLSRLRDAQSAVETCDALTTSYAQRIEPAAFAGVRAALVARRENVVTAVADSTTYLAEVVDRMTEGRDPIGAWRVKRDGFRALREGLVKTYARCRSTMKTACEDPTRDHLHAWRKRVKYHRSHMLLLRGVWREPMRSRTNEAYALSELLGDDHDLAILRDALVQLDVAADHTDALRALDELADQRQAELRASARSLGARLFAETPKRFGRRIEEYWKAWHRAGDSRARRDED